MTEQNDPPPLEQSPTQTQPTRRDLRQQSSPQVEPSQPRPEKRMSAPREPLSQIRTLRNAAILTIVAGLISTVALPAYGTWQSTDKSAPTQQQLAAADAQSLVVASDLPAFWLARDGYSATTSEEIAERKTKEAAAAAAAKSARAAITAEAPASFDYGMVTTAGGTVRWPVGGPFTITDRFGARGGAHMGTDMVAAGGTPVYAALDGTVSVSQDSYGGYGVTVTLESNLNGQRVGTVYPHMQSGSRQVSPGQAVSAGQLLGYVGSTGRSTANHLHFEVYTDGVAVDSLIWLQANTQ